MGKFKLAKRYTTDNTVDRLVKLEEKVKDILYENGHTFSMGLVEDIAVLIYQREEVAFEQKDHSKL